jgi:ketosteroid isomerase-like protein
MTESELIEHAKAFVAAVAAGGSRESIEAFYADDIIQEEFPNLLMPKGAVRDFINLRAAYDQSRYAIASQSYEVVNAIASGNTVALETIWTATLALGFGTLKPGDTMRARFAQFFDFRGGLIVRIRNYDCFDPW